MQYDFLRDYIVVMKNTFKLINDVKTLDAWYVNSQVSQFVLSQSRRYVLGYCQGQPDIATPVDVYRAFFRKLPCDEMHFVLECMVFNLKELEDAAEELADRSILLRSEEQ